MSRKGKKPEERKMSNVTSLEARRARQNQEARQESLAPEQRIRELEEEVGRVIDLSLENEHRIFILERQLSQQRKNLMKLLRLLKAEGISTSSAVSPQEPQP